MLTLSAPNAHPVCVIVQTARSCSQLLANVADLYCYPTRLIVHLIYACGLRVCEPLNLRVKDLDLKRRRLHIH